MRNCRLETRGFKLFFSPVYSNNETRRPATTSTVRKTSTASDDWLGLRPNTSVTDVPPSLSYEPSSRGPNATRRQQNFRRQNTQQRASRSAGLLFSDDDDDDDDEKHDHDKNKIKKTADGGSNVFDLFENTAYHGSGRPVTTTMIGGGDSADRLPTSTTAVANSTTLTKRRETSPSIATTAAKNNTAAAGKRLVGNFYRVCRSPI